MSKPRLSLATSDTSDTTSASSASIFMRRPAVFSALLKHVA